MQGLATLKDVVFVQCRQVRERLTDDRIAALSAGGQPTFLIYSCFVWRLYQIAMVVMPYEEVEAVVLSTHRAFLKRMLARRSFNAMLTLVRETNSLLKKARTRGGKQPRDSDEAEGQLSSTVQAAMQPTLEWLKEHHVVEELLTVNMHQRQYVESVQQLLTTLADVSALDKDVLVNLWSKLRQVRSCLLHRVLSHIFKVAA
jgi:hypothetical protein